MLKVVHDVDVSNENGAAGGSDFTAKNSTSAPRTQKRYAASNAAWPESSSTTSTPTTKPETSLANRQRLDIGETHD